MSAHSETSSVTSSARRGRAAKTYAGRSSRRNQVLVGTALALLAAVGLAPFVFMVVTSFKTNEEYFASAVGPPTTLHWENYADAWAQIEPYFLTTLVVAAGSILGALLLSAGAAFVFARFRFPGRSLLFGLIALLLMVPGIASLIPMFVLVKDLGLLNTHWVLMLPHIVGGSILGTILLKTFCETLPQEMFDAARIDGATGKRMFLSLMLPLSAPTLATIALVTVIGVWNDFFWPLLTVSDNELRTMSAGLQFFNTQNGTQYGPLFAGYVLASLPLLVLFTVMSKNYLAGLQGGTSVDK